MVAFVCCVASACRRALVLVARGGGQLRPCQSSSAAPLHAAASYGMLRGGRATRLLHVACSWRHQHQPLPTSPTPLYEYNADEASLFPKKEKSTSQSISNEEQGKHAEELQRSGKEEDEEADVSAAKPGRYMTLAFHPAAARPSATSQRQPPPPGDPADTPQSAARNPRHPMERLQHRQNNKTDTESLVVRSSSARHNTEQPSVRADAPPAREDYTARGSQFERFCAALLQRIGAEAEVTGRAGDCGIDIRGTITSSNTPIVVQCKYSKAKSQPSQLRDFEGVLTRQEPGTIGIFCSSTGFTRAAKEVCMSSRFPLVLWTLTEAADVHVWRNPALKRVGVNLVDVSPKVVTELNAHARGKYKHVI